MSTRNRQRKTVAIDWDAHTLRIVDAMLTKRGVQIDKLLAVAIPPELDPSDPVGMGKYIRRTLDQEDITTRHAVVDVPRDQVILKTLSLPIAQKEELPGMVEIQIAKELPFPVDEAVVDFAVSPRRDDEAAGDVLVGAVRREQLELIEATFEAAGLRLDRVGLRPYANKVAVEALLEHGMPDRVMFIDVRRSFMEIDVVREGALSFSRSASVTIPQGLGTSPILSIAEDGGTPPDEAGSVGAGASMASAELSASLGPLLLEVTRSIEAYRMSDPGAIIDHVVIGGDVGVEEALAEAIQKRLDITTQLYNPATTFGWEPDEGAAASAYAASLGLVLGHADDGTFHFDFLHPKRTVSATHQRLKRAPIAAAVGVLFVVAAGVAMAQVTKRDRSELARIEKRIGELEKEEKEYKRFLNVVDQIDTFEDQNVWVDVFHDVMSLLPSNREIVLNSVEMNQKDGRLTLKTRTKGRDTASELVTALREFRREGKTKPRFDGSIGPQAEKKGEKYPYYQDVQVTVLDDAARAKAGADRPTRG